MSNLKFYKPPAWLNLTVAVLTVTSLLGGIPFSAQAIVVPLWPTSWTSPSQCTTDVPEDENPGQLDLYGTSVNPAVGYSLDANYYYFRERVAGNPSGPGGFSQHAWVVLFQTASPKYQYIGAVNGKDELVQLWQNTTVGADVDWSPLFNDEAETIIWQDSTATYARQVSAGSGIYFVDWAIPLTAFSGTGITADTTKFFATSADANNYNKDHLNCYNQIADLSVSKVDDADPVSVGDTLTYTITVTNGGPDTSDGVVVNDTLPADLTYVSHVASQGTYSSGVWTVGTLTNGANATLTIDATVDAGASGTTLSNTATVTATTLDNVTTNNSDTETTAVNAVPTTGTLSIVKVVTNNNGGSLAADDFSFQIDGGSATVFEADGQNDVTVAAGTHTVTEVAPSGYTAAYNNCTSVNVPAAGSATCTITNTDDVPSLTLVKNVVNDNGGTALATAWLLSATGGSTPISGAGGVVSDSTFAAGTYALGESGGPAGYSSSNWVCVGGVQSGSSITVGLGQSATCTITNDDISPVITVTKVVTNDNGGSAIVANFPLFVNAIQVSSGVATPFNVGSYVVSETGMTGYSSTISGDCDAQGNVTLVLGDTKNCTITNDDIAPKLTVTKIVSNDDGGNNSVQDFPLFVNSNPVTSGAQNTYNVGTYTVSETSATGYVGTIGGACAPDGTVTLNPGDVKECTITNDDVAPGLTLVKQVTNNNGGTAVVSDFNLYIDQVEVVSGNSNPVEANTTYTLTEDGVAGYAAGQWSCNAGTQVGNTITLGEGETVTCTITNDDIAPSLTLVKSVMNNDGGGQLASAWTLNASGLTSISGAGGAVSDSTFSAGTYTLSETGPDDYTASAWVCQGGSQNDDQITLSLGQSATCTITNDDVEPLLTVTKVVMNDSETGSSQVADFDLFVDQTQVTSGDQNGFNAGSYTVSETGPAGYTASFSGDCATDGSVTLAIGDVKTCTITNNDNDPTEGTLTVTKTVVGGTLGVGDFPLFVDQTQVTSGQANNFLADDYVVSETSQPNYSAGEWGGDCDAEGNITIEAGNSYSCSITNTYVPPVITTGTIEVCKYNDTNGDGQPEYQELTSVSWLDKIKNFFVNVAHAITLTPSNPLSGWTINISDGDELSDSKVTGENGCVQFTELPFGTYTITETAQSNWSQTYPNDPNSIQVVLNNEFQSGYYFLNHFTEPTPPCTSNCGGGGGGGGGGSPLADLSLTKTVVGGDPTSTGTVFSYTVTVSNSGPSNATNVVVTDVLPASVTYSSSTASQGSYDNTTGKWTVGTLAVGSSATLQLTGTLVAGGTTTNFSSAISSENDPNVSNNTATYTFALGGGVTPPAPQVLGAQTELPRTGGMPIGGMLYLSWLAPFFERFRLRKIKK